MSALRAGTKPVLSSCALAALTAIAGCSSTGSNSYTAESVPVAKVAQAATPVEDDGLPSQAPPPGRIRLMPDNPGEPFSKNYGGGNPAALGIGKSQPGTDGNATAVPAPKVPANAPASPADRGIAVGQKVAAYAQDE